MRFSYSPVKGKIKPAKYYKPTMCAYGPRYSFLPATHVEGQKKRYVFRWALSLIAYTFFELNPREMKDRLVPRDGDKTNCTLQNCLVLTKTLKHQRSNNRIRKVDYGYWKGELPVNVYTSSKTSKKTGEIAFYGAFFIGEKKYITSEAPTIEIVLELLKDLRRSVGVMKIVKEKKYVVQSADY